MAKQQADRLRPYHSILALARSRLLDDLTGSELVVYLRLVALTNTGGPKHPLSPINRDLHRDASTASRALAGLVGQRLIRVRTVKGTRVVEVL